MKGKDIDKLDLPDAKRILKSVFNNPLLNVYISTRKQVDNIAEQIEEAEIRFGEDSDAFNEFVKWGDKLQKFTDLLYDLETKIDPTELARAKRERLKPSKLKPEYYAKQRKDKKGH